MKKLLMVFCCGTFLYAVDLGTVGEIADNSSAIDITQAEKESTDPLKKPTNGEVGIIATMAGVYAKSREAVKTVYDEIQYWKGIKATYGMLKNWFASQKSRFREIGRTAETLFTEPGDIFTKLEITEYLFDQTDMIIYKSPKELDYIFGNGELYWDKIADNKLSGALLPNTAETMEKFDLMIMDSDLPADLKTKVVDESRNPQAEKQFIDNSAELFNDVNTSSMPEKQIIDLIKGMTASTVENSSMYTKWAVEASVNLAEKQREIDAKFAAGEMDNLMDLQVLAGMQEIEQININNKRIMHSLELLKGYHSILGMEIWMHNARKTQDEAVVAEVLDIYADIQYNQTIVDANINRYGSIRRP